MIDLSLSIFDIFNVNCAGVEIIKTDVEAQAISRAV